MRLRLFDEYQMERLRRGDRPGRGLSHPHPGVAKRLINRNIIEMSVLP